MKYILAKDLPFAKAGTEVTVNMAGGTSLGGDLYSFGKDGLNSIPVERLYLGDVNELLATGWIKKIEPRECYLLNNRELSDRMFYRSMEEFEKDAPNCAVKDLIKVREVIE